MNIQRLFFYPVKSCLGVEVQALDIGPTGPYYDREWLIVDGTGRFVTQRDPGCEKLCFVQPGVHNDSLSLSFNNQTFHITPPTTTSLIPVNVWKESVEAVDQGDEIAAVLSEFLSKSVRLVRLHQNHLRKRNGPTISFVDGYSMMLFSEASLDRLNRDISGPSLIPVENFRPNIIISGVEAYAEDEWNNISVNGIQMRGEKLCTRCRIPTINLATGISEPWIMQGLMKHRKDVGGDKGVMFGKYFTTLNTGTISVGDGVEVE